MFLVKYILDDIPGIENHHVCNDTKDVRDIIIGISNDEQIANCIYNEVCNMTFGDRIDYPWGPEIKVMCFDYDNF